MTCDLVEALSEMDLVGRFKYIKLSRSEILDWIHCKWKPFISNMSWVMMIANGWVVFHFMSKEDRKPTGGRLWVIGRRYLVLVRW